MIFECSLLKIINFLVDFINGLNCSDNFIDYHVRIIYFLLLANSIRFIFKGIQTISFYNWSNLLVYYSNCDLNYDVSLWQIYYWYNLVNELNLTNFLIFIIYMKTSTVILLIMIPMLSIEILLLVVTLTNIFYIFKITLFSVRICIFCNEFIR